MMGTKQLYCHHFTIDEYKHLLSIWFLLLGREWDRQELRFGLDFTFSLFYHENTPAYGEKGVCELSALIGSLLLVFAYLTEEYIFSSDLMRRNL